MDLPLGWAAAAARWLEPDDDPAICRHFFHLGECDRDPRECDEDARERADEARFEARRQEWWR